MKRAPKREPESTADRLRRLGLVKSYYPAHRPLVCPEHRGLLIFNLATLELEICTETGWQPIVAPEP